MSDVWSERAEAYVESDTHREGSDLDLLVSWAEGKTALDVAITVVRLMAAAAWIGRFSARLRNGTRKTPPPMPSSAPRLPATAPATKTISASGVVTTGIRLRNECVSSREPRKRGLHRRSRR